MRQFAAVVLQIVGILAVAVGVGLEWAWLGVAVGGAGAFAVGFQLERELANTESV